MRNNEKREEKPVLKMLMCNFWVKIPGTFGGKAFLGDTDLYKFEQKSFAHFSASNRNTKERLRLVNE